MIEKLYKIFKKSSGISIDTRTLNGKELFFCLRGANFNGNKFAEQALNKGAKYVVLDDQAFYDEKNPNQLLVEDSLKTLQHLASFHRQNLEIPIIGITGTNGKTTTKELIAAALKTQYKVFATEGNFNNHIGVPLSLLSINKKHQLAVIEMGANHVGEIAELCELSQPILGILTNIGHAHLEGFGSFENIKETKLALYQSVKDNSGFVFVHFDDEVLMEESKHIKRMTYGMSTEADVSAKLIPGKPNLEIEYKSEKISTNLFGEFNYYNVLAALAVGNYFKVSTDNMVKALETYHPANNRSQIEKGENNLLILDAYNANPDSMRNAIAFFGRINAYAKSLILGDMLELGKFEESKHREILELISNLQFDHIFLVGNAFGNLKSEFSQFEFFQNSEDAKKHFEQFPIRSNQVLLKGSRGIRLEILKEILL